MIAGEAFKSSQFLKWSPENKQFYIRTSIGMASLIAARNDKKHAKCIDDWYFTDMKKGDEAVIEAMRQYPDYHPRALILAVLQKACGSFSYVRK